MISGSQAKANLAARTYLVEEEALDIKPLCITFSGVSLYINPAKSNPTKFEDVIGAWAEPCRADYKKNIRRYSDKECFFFVDKFVGTGCVVNVGHKWINNDGRLRH
jgi:hypothetical protein